MSGGGSTVPILVVMQHKKTIRRRDGMFPAHGAVRLSTHAALPMCIHLEEASDYLEARSGMCPKMITAAH